MTGSSHNPRGNGNNESNGSDGNKCLEHNSNSCTYLLESIATDYHAQADDKEYEQEFNHVWEMLANDKG